MARLLPGSCSCGRTTVRMEKVVGRNDDMLIIRGVNVFPSQIETVLLGMGQVEPHYQLVVTRGANHIDELEVRVESSSVSTHIIRSTLDANDDVVLIDLFEGTDYPTVTFAEDGATGIYSGDLVTSDDTVFEEGDYRIAIIVTGSVGIGIIQFSVTAAAPTAFAVEITPASQDKSGAPGDTVSYTFTVTNNGTETDSYTISTASTWTSSVTPTSLNLAGGASEDVIVSHDIPVGAADGASNVGELTASSVNANDTAAFTTTTAVGGGGGVTVDSIEPNTIDAGDTIPIVTITGSGFDTVNGADVTFENGKGPTPTASNISVVDANKITATVTAKANGPSGNIDFDLRVTNNTDASTGVGGPFTVVRP